MCVHFTYIISSVLYMVRIFWRSGSKNSIFGRHYNRSALPAHGTRWVHLECKIIPTVDEKLSLTSRQHWTLDISFHPTGWNTSNYYSPVGNCQFISRSVDKWHPYDSFLEEKYQTHNFLPHCAILRSTLVHTASATKCHKLRFLNSACLHFCSIPYVHPTQTLSLKEQPRKITKGCDAEREQNDR